LRVVADEIDYFINSNLLLNWCI